jgi:hypothetical protein
MDNVSDVKESLSRQNRKIGMVIAIILSSLLIDMAMTQTIFLTLLLGILGLGILAHICFKKWWILKQNSHLFEIYDSNYNKAKYYNVLCGITVLLVILIVLFSSISGLFYIAIALGLFFGVVFQDAGECERNLK